MIWCIFSTILCSIAPVIQKGCINSGSKPIEIMISYNILMLVISLVLFFLKDAKDVSIKKNGICKKMFISILFNSIGNTCLIISLFILDPISLSLIGRSYLLFVTIFSFLILKKKSVKDALDLIIISLCLINVFFINRLEYVNIFFGMLAPLSFAFSHINFQQSRQKTISLLFLISSFFTIIVLYIIEPLNFTIINFYNIDNNIWFSVLCTSIGIYLYFHSLTLVNILIASSIRSTTPLFTIFFTKAILNINIDYINIINVILLLIPLIKNLINFLGELNDSKV